MKSKILWIFFALAVLGTVAYIFFIEPYLKQMSEIKTVIIDDKLTLFLGGGGNSAILSGGDKIVVIDTKMSKPAITLRELAVQTAQNKPIVVINTHIHRDHVSGNSLYRGSQIYAGGNYSREYWSQQAPPDTRPTDLVKNRTELTVGDETIILMNMPYSVHTQSDMAVYLKNRKILFTGDLVLNDQVPSLIPTFDASSEGYMKAFDHLQESFEIVQIVPGHGGIGGLEIIEKFKQYFLDMKAAAEDSSLEDSMKEKYKNWKQFPIIMDNNATIKFLREETK